MILGTQWDPWMAFMSFARDMLRALAAGDYGLAFKGLDANPDGTRWTRRRFESALAALTSGSVTSPDDQAKSARPLMDVVREGEVYELQHAIPVAGRWSHAVIWLVFTRKASSGYYRIQLVGLERR
jgi:hypothetical protein